MRAADIGTTRVIHLNESASVKEAAHTMQQHDVGCVVVMRNTLLGALPTGIVTDRDLAIRFLNGDSEDKSLRELESTPLAVCRPDATIDELIDVMLGSHVRRLPIVDEQDRLIGIVALDDVLAALAELMHRVSAALTGERQIEEVEEEAAVETPAPMLATPHAA